MLMWSAYLFPFGLDGAPFPAYNFSGAVAGWVVEPVLYPSLVIFAQKIYAYVV